MCKVLRTPSRLNKKKTISRVNSRDCLCQDGYPKRSSHTAQGLKLCPGHSEAGQTFPSSADPDSPYSSSPRLLISGSAMTRNPDWTRGAGGWCRPHGQSFLPGQGISMCGAVLGLRPQAGTGVTQAVGTVLGLGGIHRGAVSTAAMGSQNKIPGRSMQCRGVMESLKAGV